MLPWLVGATQPIPHAALVIDTSGSMVDNDPRRHAIHFAKVLGRTVAGAGAVDVFHAKNADCRAESVTRNRLDGADPAGWEEALERQVRYAGINVFGPVTDAAEKALGTGAPAVLLLLADQGGRAAAEVRARTDAEIERRVAEAGGRHGDIDVRVSLLWNTADDLDFYVIMPSGTRIYHGNKNAEGGVLDVDRNVGQTTREPVENVRWARGKAPRGEYRVVVRNHDFNESRHRPVPFTVEIVSGGRVERHKGTISPNGETGSDSDLHVARFRYPSPRPEVDRGALAADISRQDQALNPDQGGCPDPLEAIEAAKRAGADLVSIQLGVGASPFHGLPSMDARLKNRNSADLTAAVATVAKRWFGRTGLQQGAGNSRVELRIPEHTGELLLLISGDGDLSRLRPSGSNPSATAVELDVATGRTASADGGSHIDYRVIRIREPAAGVWRFHADGVALGWLYELKQSWGLRPDLPATHRRDTPLRISATLAQLDRYAPPVPGSIVARADGIEVELRDDGSNGDEAAGDQIYSGLWTPPRIGPVRFEFVGRGEAKVETPNAEVDVVGWVELSGPERIDFGTLASREHSDATLDLSASDVHGSTELH